MIIVNTWSNGNSNPQTGSGYGIRIRKQDRRQFSGLQSISVKAGGKIFDVHITASFWKACTEFRHSEIGKFLIANQKHHWPKGFPHRLKLVQLQNNQYELQMTNH